MNFFNLYPPPPSLYIGGRGRPAPAKSVTIAALHADTQNVKINNVDKPTQKWEEEGEKKQDRDELSPQSDELHVTTAPQSPRLCETLFTGK